MGGEDMIDKNEILGAALAIVFIIVGIVGANITNGAGKYVETQFANAINTTPSDIEVVSLNSVSGVLGATFTMLGVAVLGGAIGMMLAYLIGGISRASASV